MLAKFRSRRPSPALVVALMALFVALGGSSYAALRVTGKNVKNSSLTGKDVKNNSLTGSDVKNLASGDVKDSSLLAKDFKPGQLPAGPKGDTGPQGPTGLPPQQTLEVGAYSAHLPSNMSPSDSGCVEHASDNNLLNARVDLSLPAGAVITAIRARYVDTSNGAVTFYLQRVVFDGSRTDTIVASGGSSDAPSEGLTPLTLFAGGLPAVSDTNYYYLIVSKSVTTHTGSLAFCGLAVDYQLPT